MCYSYSSDLIPCEITRINVKKFYVYYIDYEYNLKEHYLYTQLKIIPDSTDYVFIWRGRSLRVWYILQMYNNIWFFSISGITQFTIFYLPEVKHKCQPLSNDVYVL